MDNGTGGHCAPEGASTTASNIANHAPKSPSAGNSEPLLGDSSKNDIRAGQGALPGHERWHKRSIGDVR